MSWVITHENGKLLDHPVQSKDYAKSTIPCKYQFRMYDRKGRLVYEGWSSVVNQSPLIDYGAGKCGFTLTIKYYNSKSGEWEEL